MDTLKNIIWNNIEIDDKSYKNVYIYSIGYVTFKKDYKFTFLKELMLIKQVHQKSVMFVTIGIS